MQIIPPGTRIGQYEIASRPMMGGMGVVYFALDHGNDGRPVALKTFRPELLLDRAARDRFLREGSAWIELGSHPHIVHCYKVEYIDPTALLVLELIAKEQNMPDAALRSWLIPGQPLPLEQALLFALQIARGMQYATEKIPGFVHRDLKPENILVGADKLPGTNINRLRVTDFGLVTTIIGGDISSMVSNVKELKLNQVQFTHGVGTPLYMAPEQWIGEPVGVFTDIYAFGCILFEMLAGQHAVVGQSIGQLQQAHCDGKHQPILESMPGDIKFLLAKCLQKDSRQRFGNWDDLTETIQRVCSKQGKVFPLQILEGSNKADFSDRKQAISSYIALGASYLDLEKNKQAIKCFEKSLAISQEFNNRYGELVAYSNLGIAYKNLEDNQMAINCHERALAITRDFKDSREEGHILTNLGIAYKNIGDLHKAIEYYEKSLFIAREIKDTRGESSVLGNLGVAYETLGDLPNAIT